MPQPPSARWLPRAASTSSACRSRHSAVYNVQLIDDPPAAAWFMRALHPPWTQDPFDRLIAAQCLQYDLTLVSVDEQFDAYGVRRVW